MSSTRRGKWPHRNGVRRGIWI